LKFGENLVMKKLLEILPCLFDDARTEFLNGCNRFATGAIAAGWLAGLQRALRRWLSF
jgi:hypothetical protein